MIKLLDVVHLKDPDDKFGLSIDDKGTVVEVLSDGVYMVEFVDSDGNTIESSLDRAFYHRELVAETA
jgi:hypothetical protein